ncbi:MAG TPA: type 4a pilus biogenesis protein PilO [Candidatus Acidoferrales bacterium]|nr:type 4a pilus biogenesis protein PilO [Candidatus Acidoferrales bacterium]
MATFRELPFGVQAVIFVALAVVLVAAGEYVPGLPIQAVRAQRDTLNTKLSNLNEEVKALQYYDVQKAQLAADIQAMQKQLDTLKAIVPDDKQVDEFIKAISDSASASKISIRRLTAKPIEPKDYFYEVPFEVAVDGPYFQVVEFFERLSRLSRIINVADITFSAPSSQYQGGPTPPPFPLRPGTTVFGTFTATTYFTGGSQAPPKPGQKPGAGPGK